MRDKIVIKNSGDTFKGKSGTEYIFLERTENGDVCALRKDLLPKKMQFGNSNDFSKSNINTYLNTVYLKELEADFGTKNIVEQDVSLFSMDGLDDYGNVGVKVGLLDFNRYRRCRKAVGENMPDWWWLIDPDSTPSGYGSSLVRVVASSGDVFYADCGRGCGVRPFCILKSSIFSEE